MVRHLHLPLGIRLPFSEALLADIPQNMVSLRPVTNIVNFSDKLDHFGFLEHTNLIFYLAWPTAMSPKPFCAQI